MKLQDTPIELLKACFRCEKCPQFSSFGSLGLGITTFSVVCCMTINSKNIYEGINKWNTFNKEAKTTFKFNRETKDWEIYEANYT